MPAPLPPTWRPPRPLTLSKQDCGAPRSQPQEDRGARNVQRESGHDMVADAVNERMHDSDADICPRKLDVQPPEFDPKRAFRRAFLGEQSGDNCQCVELSWLFEQVGEVVGFPANRRRKVFAIEDLLLGGRVANGCFHPVDLRNASLVHPSWCPVSPCIQLTAHPTDIRDASIFISPSMKNVHKFRPTTEPRRPREVGGKTIVVCRLSGFRVKFYVSLRNLCDLLISFHPLSSPFPVVYMSRLMPDALRR